MTFAAGLASEGMKPVAAIYSTFLQRAYDQVVHDVCLQNLDVTMALDRAGLVGAVIGAVVAVLAESPLIPLLVTAGQQDRRLLHCIYNRHSQADYVTG